MLFGQLFHIRSSRKGFIFCSLCIYAGSKEHVDRISTHVTPYKHCIDSVTGYIDTQESIFKMYFNIKCINVVSKEFIYY